MTIHVPFHLHRRSRAEPAEALLIPSRDPRVLVAFCATLGLDPRGRVFDIAGGFLLELERPSTDPMPGAVRLRSVAKALFVPVDSELLPSLLSDEASGLVRDWGLVFSPDGGALLFDRHAPLDMNEIVKGEPRPRRSWSSFPKPRSIAERLVEITFERPDPPADDLYDDFKRAVGGQSGRVGSAATEAETPDRGRWREPGRAGGRPGRRTARTGRAIVAGPG